MKKKDLEPFDVLVTEDGSYNLRIGETNGLLVRDFDDNTICWNDLNDWDDDLTFIDGYDDGYSSNIYKIYRRKGGCSINDLLKDFVSNGLQETILKYYDLVWDVDWDADSFNSDVDEESLTLTKLIIHCLNNLSESERNKILKEFE